MFIRDIYGPIARNVLTPRHVQRTSVLSSLMYHSTDSTSKSVTYQSGQSQSGRHHHEPIGIYQFRRYSRPRNVPNLSASVTANTNDEDDQFASIQRQKARPGGATKFRRTTEEAEAYWGRLCARFPELEEFGKGPVIKYLEMMSYQGIPSDNATEMLLLYPPLLKRSEDSIAQTLLTLRATGFSEKQRNKLVHHDPRVFDLTRTHIIKRMGLLRTYFENPSEVLEVVLNSIECLVDDESIVTAKLRYLIIEMSHETKNIKCCHALSRSLEFMTIRHQFLIKAGLFKPIFYHKLIKVLEQEKGNRTPREKYFTPEDLLCTNDKEFLRFCTKGAFNLNQYAAFEEIYLTTIANEMDKEEEDEDSDEDSDDEGPVVLTNSGGFGNAAENEQFYF